MARSTKTAAEFVPGERSLPVLREAVQGCRGCDLYLHATQAVFGEGPTRGGIVFVGEQPGDEEDRTGRPFVGPAGKLFDKALAAAGIDRSSTYVTNAVKHFKFEERGKRRIHKKPSDTELQACRPWLEAELAAIKPQLLVCLGASAAKSIFGNEYRLTQERGKFVEHPLGPLATSTVHPAAILRSPDKEQRDREYEHFVKDLTKVRTMYRGM